MADYDIKFADLPNDVRRIIFDELRPNDGDRVGMGKIVHALLHTCKNIKDLFPPETISWAPLRDTNIEKNGLQATYMDHFFSAFAPTSVQRWIAIKMDKDLSSETIKNVMLYSAHQINSFSLSDRLWDSKWQHLLEYLYRPDSTRTASRDLFWHRNRTLYIRLGSDKILIKSERILPIKNMKCVHIISHGHEDDVFSVIENVLTNSRDTLQEIYVQVSHVAWEADNRAMEARFEILRDALMKFRFDKKMKLPVIGFNIVTRSKHRATIQKLKGPFNSFSRCVKAGFTPEMASLCCFETVHLATDADVDYFCKVASYGRSVVDYNICYRIGIGPMRQLMNMAIAHPYYSDYTIMVFWREFGHRLLLSSHLTVGKEPLGEQFFVSQEFADFPILELLRHRLAYGGSPPVFNIDLLRSPLQSTLDHTKGIVYFYILILQMLREKLSDQNAEFQKWKLITWMRKVIGAFTRNQILLVPEHWLQLVIDRTQEELPWDIAMSVLIDVDVTIGYACSTLGSRANLFFYRLVRDSVPIKNAMSSPRTEYAVETLRYYTIELGYVVTDDIAKLHAKERTAALVELARKIALDKLNINVRHPRVLVKGRSTIQLNVHID